MRRLVLLAIAACGLPDFTVADAGVDAGSDAAPESGVTCPSGSLDTRFGDAGRVVFRSSAAGPDDWFVHLVTARGPNGVVAMSLVDLPDGGQTNLVALDPNGAFDTSFGDAGRAAFPELPRGYGVASDALGRIYVAGPSAQGPYVVARLDVSGNLDTTFGTNGVASYNADGQALRLAVDDQGRAVIAGSTSGGAIRVVRFTNAGVLDSTFAGGGAQTYNYVLADAGTSSVTALTVDGESPIICGKVTPNGAVYCARLLSSGAPDDNFGTNSAITYPQGPPSFVESLTLDRTNQGAPTIIAMGWGGYAAAPTSWAVRYSSTGSVLTTFESISGFAGVVFKGGIVEADGKVLLVGAATPDGAHFEWLVARYQPYGLLDPGFGTSGVTLLQIYGNEYANAAVVDPSGQVVVVGAATDAGFGDPSGASAAARFCQ